MSDFPSIEKVIININEYKNLRTRSGDAYSRGDDREAMELRYKACSYLRSAATHLEGLIKKYAPGEVKIEPQSRIIRLANRQVGKKTALDRYVEAINEDKEAEPETDEVEDTEEDEGPL